MSFDPKFTKSFGPIEHRTLGLTVVAGLVLSLTYFSSMMFYSFPFTKDSLRMPSMENGTPESSPNSVLSEIQNATLESSSVNTLELGKKDDNETHTYLAKLVSKSENLTFEEPDQRKDVTGAMNSSMAIIDINSTQIPYANTSNSLSGNTTESLEKGLIIDILKLDLSYNEVNGSTSKNSSSTTMKNTTVSLAKKDITINSTVESVRKKNIDKPMYTKPLCDFSNRRSNICDMHGDIRIHGKSSFVMSFTSFKKNESYEIRPYARKTDLAAMSTVTKLTVKSSSYENAVQCSSNHSVPAVIFSVSGYTGNFFHDFTDILVPLFLTSYQFNGEVQFLVTNFRLWWIHKYLPIIQSLTNYELIDLDKSDQVHCFKQVIVGLKSDNDLKIDKAKSPDGISMVDFTKFLRKAYSLPRESPLIIKKSSHKKPRLLIVARGRTRKFMNLNSIVKMAQKVGYEVIVGEAEANITHFAHIVNRCDVMMGVHGAGLTNFMFLPTNAILIQVVPWGNLDWIARTYFDEPSKGMNLRYLEYRIEVDESTLIDMYPRNDPVLKDPISSVHKYGWDSVKEMYLVKQNVKLNVRRFRPVLMKALKLLHEQ